MLCLALCETMQIFPVTRHQMLAGTLSGWGTVAAYIAFSSYSTGLQQAKGAEDD